MNEIWSGLFSVCFSVLHLVSEADEDGWCVIRGVVGVILVSPDWEKQPVTRWRRVFSLLVGVHVMLFRTGI